MSKTTRNLIFLIFIVSGFCGLLYQVVWVRIAYVSFGVITPVLSVIVSVFMLGLSLGSWFGGKWIGKLRSWTGLSPLIIYGVSELLIGLGAYQVPKLFSFGEQFLFSTGEMDSVQYLFFSALAIGVSILPWCILMGFTFPFMMAFIKEIDFENTNSFSFLYLANVIGAMLGTLVTALILIELLGFSNTLMIAVCSNMGIGILSILLGSRYRKHKISGIEGPTAQRKVSGPAVLPRIEERIICFLLFTTGFVSMSMEIVWIRAFTPILKTQTYSFAKLLAVYLLATWIGSYLYRRDLSNKNVKSLEKLLAAMSVFAVLPIVLPDPRLGPGAWIALTSIFPFCAALGYLTPQLIDQYSGGQPYYAGKAYAINVIGSILGPLFASYLFLPVLGVKTTLLVLAAPLLIFFLIRYMETIYIKDWSLIMVILALVLFFRAALVNVSFEEIHQNRKGSIVRRDHTATVISSGEGWNKRLLVNGIGITKLTPITKNMAHLPLMFLKDKPKSALVICLGMGTTFRSMLSWNIDSTAVELVPSVYEAMGYYFDDTEQIMKNPKGRVIIDDGRRFLKRTNLKFDMITIDPPPPVEAAGSGMLYSEEFYDIVIRHLHEDGILQQWFPYGEKKILNAVARSLTNKFKYIKVFRSFEKWGYHFIASAAPIDIPDVKTAISRMPETARNDLMEWFDSKDIEIIIKNILNKEIKIENALSPDMKIVITDDRPFNEYYLIRRFLDSGNSDKQIAY